MISLRQKKLEFELKLRKKRLNEAIMNFRNAKI